jgi:pyruvate-ferredoxin/flavodoxin oxidoreductase
MQLAKKQSEKASKSGYWPMYRFNPELKNQNLSPFTWDSPELDTDFEKYVEEEIRYKTLKRSNPEEAERLIGLAKDDNARRFQDLKHLSDETEPVAPIENPLTEPVHD